MPTRASAPAGAPCWVDLWTSDVEDSRRFYCRIFGWEAHEPSPEFGGYFMFTRGGVPIAGGMGDMPGMRAQNVWKVYLSTESAAATVAAAQSAGATIAAPAMAVADLGTQAVLVDPTGAVLGVWQPGTFPGFTVLGEPGAPSWFELRTRDHGAAVAFYRSVFHWETEPLPADSGLTYTTARNPGGDVPCAGIMDASRHLPEGVSAKWCVCWDVRDVDATLETVKALGGSVVTPALDTPFGRFATVTDPAGAEFQLRTANR